ncbi:DUF357 domain-containing protein [Candidatus Woesearchaeota archaeon]|nr:DUF357 domain-containing protein [Candidatus Woesearchaeota archaeon]
MSKSATITDEKLDRYFSVTRAAIAKVVISAINEEQKRIAEDLFDMAQRYFSDAAHFREKGDFVSAFGAVNYAHAWLDAGARMGLFDVHDSDLFASD